MGFDQFTERKAVAGFALFDSTYTPGAGMTFWPSLQDPSRVDQIIGINGDVVDHVISVTDVAGFGEPIGFVTIHAGAGHGSVAAVDVLAGLIPSVSQQFLLVLLGGGLTADCLVAPTVAGKVSLRAQGGQF